MYVILLTRSLFLLAFAKSVFLGVGGQVSGTKGSLSFLSPEVSRVGVLLGTSETFLPPQAFLLVLPKIKKILLK